LELVATSSNFIVAGAETTATLLTGLLYYLLTNNGLQFCYGNLASLFRSYIRPAEAITMDMDVLTKYPFKDLDCCINEALHLFPPLPGNLRRIVPPEGKLICGKWVPGGKLVAADVFSANTSSHNFFLPNHFIPDRWLPGDEKQECFNNDKLDSVQTFSFGPRNCIGRNLAMMEIKLILVRLLWQFDIELEEESKGLD
jgi:cytochrome P450